MAEDFSRTDAARAESDEWQVDEIQAGIEELESGGGVSHEEVVKWLRSWGTPGEEEAPL